VILVFVPVRRRRRRGGTDAGTADGVEAGPSVATPVADGPDRPTLAVPFRSGAPPAEPWVALVSGLVAGLVAGAIASPLDGVGVAVATAIVLVVPRLRVVLGLIAIAGIVAAGTYVAVHQHAAQVPPGGDWTLSFGTASRLAWAGVVFLGADALVEIVLHQGSPGAGAGGPTD
jgi:hypothetical protein